MGRINSLWEKCLLSFFAIYFFVIIFIKQSTIGDTYTSLTTIATIMVNISLLVFSIQVLFINRYTLKQWIVLIITFLIISFSSFVANDQVLLSSFIVAFAFKNFSYKKLVSISFYSTLIAFIIVVVLSSMSIINPNLIYRGAGVIRTAFGFLHPNIAGAIYLSLIVRLLEIKKSNMSFLWLLLIGLFSTYFFTKTDSKTTIVMLVVTALFFFAHTMFKDKKGYDSIIFFIGTITTPMMFLSSLLLAVNYPTSQFSIKINDLLTGRIYYIKQFLDKYGISLIGQEINLLSWADSKTVIGSVPMILDNSYMQLLIKFGFIPSLLYLIIITAIIWKLYKTDNIFQIIVIIVFQLFGFSQSQMLQVSINYSILLVSLILNNKKVENLNEKNFFKSNISRSISNN